ncbi:MULTISPECIES: glycosyltransferase family 39 protein [unclassified Crossiella]|uniref:glycosyltransferase family 39 protein n=1 Tax=unclassified Crossiella TaxID=2620835 RepID=UPI001FFE8478|nr:MULTISPECIES: glycosyltransferase family 39 protein [unclassified Crossiella]MCK2240849.1 glycosyltransferase family 39 protein [Crossiella sp. S99.2]MCK2254007.1 glycosyltransferase family 39 protein [Crossiella sp. S99.1]
MTQVQVSGQGVQTRALPPFASVPVLAVAGVIGVLLVALADRYGWFGDELYFIAAGQRLDWGYADQGPLAPLLALAMESVFPGSLTALRLPSVLMVLATVAVTALIARELGGARRAQTLAALVTAGSPFFLGNGHLLTTNSPDVLMWALACWLLVRWVRTRRDAVLPWLGVVTAIAVQSKFLIAGFWMVLALAVLVAGPRELLRRPMLWLGAGITLLATLPSLLWQAEHGWPQLGMTGQIATEGQLMHGGLLGFVPMMLFLAGLISGLVVLLYGTWRLLRSAELRPYAFLGWTFLGVAALFLIAGGRPYYVAGMFPVVWAAGAVELSRNRVAGWWRWSASLPVAVVSTLAMSFFGLPLEPVASRAGAGSVDFISTHSVGWAELADQVAAEYRKLPPEQRARTAVLTNGYWTASALAWFGPDRGLPAPQSGSRGYWYFGAPPESADAVLFVGRPQPVLAESFRTVTQLRVLETNLKANKAVDGAPLLLATGRTQSWAELWPRFRKLG